MRGIRDHDERDTNGAAIWGTAKYWLAPVLTLVGIFVASHYGFLGTQVSIESEAGREIQSRLFDRLSDVERRLSERDSLVDQLREERAERLRSITALEIEIARLRNVRPLKIITDFLDDVPAPAWCKSKNSEGQFVMEHINPMFEFVYRIDLERYRGRTDSEIQPGPLAQQYANNDLIVWRTRGERRFIETARFPDDTEVRVEVFKFYHSVEATSQAYVCGFQITDPKDVERVENAYEEESNEEESEAKVIKGFRRFQSQYATEEDRSANEVSPDTRSNRLANRSDGWLASRDGGGLRRKRYAA